MLVNQVLGNLVHLHHPGVVTMPRNGRCELATTWEHYRFSPDGSYETAEGAVAHDFWVSIFSYIFVFITLMYYCVFIVYFILQLRFHLPEEGNHQTHTFEVFNVTAQKVMKDTISYARIQANNTYYKEVLRQKMNKKLSSSHIYLTEEQYN
jgi:hypothetical protein